MTVLLFNWQVMYKLKLVPLGSDSVEERVAAFRQYNDEVIKACFVECSSFEIHQVIITKRSLSDTINWDNQTN